MSPSYGEISFPKDIVQFFVLDRLCIKSRPLAVFMDDMGLYGLENRQNGPAGAFKQDPTVLNKPLCRNYLSNGT